VTGDGSLSPSKIQIGCIFNRCKSMCNDNGKNALKCNDKCNDKDGYYNIAGELLADENDIAFSGIDIVKFGKDINKILYRETISNKPLLSQFDRTIAIYEQYYQYGK
jgi:hypothetical protein